MNLLISFQTPGDRAVWINPAHVTHVEKEVQGLIERGTAIHFVGGSRVVVTAELDSAARQISAGIKHIAA